MHTAVFTLQYPTGLKGLPIATTSNIAALRFFKLIALKDWEGGNEEASGEWRGYLYPLEDHRLKSELDRLIPKGEVGEKR